MKHILLYTVMLFFTCVGFAVLHKNPGFGWTLLAVTWGDYVILQWMLWREDNH